MDIITAAIAAYTLLIAGAAFVFGYRSCEKHWQARAQWITGQRTVEQQMHRDGWSQP